MSCIFCKIIAQEIPAQVFFEDADFVAFDDIAPQAPTHFLVIPKTHIANLYAADDALLMGKLLLLGKDLAQQRGLGENGARFVLNCKSDGGQTVDHIHLHVLGGRALEWPPG